MASLYCHVAAADESVKEYYPQLWCPKGQYSEFGQIFFVPLVQSLKLIMHLGETHPQETENASPKQIRDSALMLYHGVIFVLMTWTYGVGAPSGLFVPCLTLGAAMGRLYAHGVMAILSYYGALSMTLRLSLHDLCILPGVRFGCMISQVWISHIFRPCQLIDLTHKF